MRTYTITLSDELAEALEAQAAEDEETINEVVTAAIENMLDAADFVKDMDPEALALFEQMVIDPQEELPFEASPTRKKKE